MQNPDGEADWRNIAPLLAMVLIIWAGTWSFDRSGWAFGLPFFLAFCCIVIAVLGAGIYIWRDSRSANRSARMQQEGKCMSCGYDISHSAERCPECGMLLWKPHAVSSAPEARLDAPDMPDE